MLDGYTSSNLSCWRARLIVAMAFAPHCACTVEALYSVFIARTVRIGAPHLRFKAKPSIHCHQSQSRLLSTTNPRFLARPSKSPEHRAQKWNSEISHRLITLVDPTTNQPESRPRTKFDVLLTLDEKTHRLVQLTPDPSPPTYDFIPICKIVSKKDEYDRERARKAQQKDVKKAKLLESSVKTLELNWAAAPNDLAHRLDKVKEFLEEGRKVEIVLAVKKRGLKASPEQCAEVLRKIRKVVDEVDGAREVKAMQGKVGAFATLSFQGTPPKTGKKVPEVKEETAAENKTAQQVAQA
nr:hypothetical protein CFP56_02488 [Quercus suber]